MSTRHDFEQLWQVEAEQVGSANRRGKGWSAVFCIPPQADGGKRSFLKRQQNYLSRTLRHPLKGQLTIENEHRVINHLADRGVGVPKVLFFGIHSEKAIRRAVFLTEALEGYLPLDEYLTDRRSRTGEAAAFHRLIRRVAAEIRKMHASGVQSRCLYPKHIFVADPEGSPSVALIDFEKARISKVNRIAFLRDLVSLNARTRDLPVRYRILFLKAYLGVSTLGWLDRQILHHIAERSS